jgi:hypothetical protein
MKLQRCSSIATCVLGMLAMPALVHAQDCGPRGIYCVGLKRLGYDLVITQMPTATVVEFSPVDVSFTLAVKEFGIIGNDPVPTEINVCPAQIRPETNCYHIAKAMPGRTYKGHLTAVAPWAGAHSPLRLVALAPGALVAGGDDVVQQIAVAEATAALSVSARYDIAIEGFNVMTTRSTSIDTIRISLQGMVKATPPHPSDNDDACHLAGFNWCIFEQKYGDAGDGPHAVSNVRIGPYELVPERENDLRFLFYVDNVGDSAWAKIGEDVANGFSKAGMIILGAYGAAQGNQGTSGFAQQLDGAMEQLHAAETASCDGVVAADVVIAVNKTIAEQPQSTLDAMTRSFGMYHGTIPKIYRNQDGDARCDQRGSAYTVSYAIYRNSWKSWGDQFSY